MLDKFSAMTATPKQQRFAEEFASPFAAHDLGLLEQVDDRINRARKLAERGHKRALRKGFNIAEPYIEGEIDLYPRLAESSDNDCPSYIAGFISNNGRISCANPYSLILNFDSLYI